MKPLGITDPFYEIRKVKVRGKKWKNYYVSTEGELFSTKGNKSGRSKDNNTILILKGETVRAHKLKLTPDKGDGYVRCNLTRDGKAYSVKLHRIVAETFIPNPKHKKEVNHIDGDKTNNKVSNLEWNTREENREHAIKTGLVKPIPKGEKCWNSKISDKQANKICKMLQANKYSYKEIIKKVGEPCTYDMIIDIKRGKTWTQVSKNYTFPTDESETYHEFKKVNKEIATKVCDLLDTKKYTINQIVELVGEPCTYYVVADIKKCKTWKDVSKNYNFYKEKMNNK